MCVRGLLIDVAKFRFVHDSFAGATTMTSSGQLYVSQLQQQALVTQHIGTGYTDNGGAGADVMGGANNDLDATYRFNAGTDFTPVTSVPGPFSSSVTSGVTVTSGSVPFSLDAGVDAGGTVFGIGVRSADVTLLTCSAIWSPDQEWSLGAQTLVDLGLNAGTYRVQDATSDNAIVIEIGELL